MYQIGAKVYLETQLTRKPNMQYLAIVFFFLLYRITCGIRLLEESSLEGIFRSVVCKAQHLNLSFARAKLNRELCLIEGTR